MKMNRVVGVLAVFALVLALAGCSSADEAEHLENSPEPTRFDPGPVVTQAEEEDADLIPVTTEDEEDEGRVAAPTKVEVLAARELALEGMSEEQVERLMQVVKSANLWWEHEYMWYDIFRRLEDPNSLTWNYFDQTGEIRIGWAYDGDLDMDEICWQENLTEDEFYAKYGAGVVAYNDYDADDFIAILEELKADVQNEKLSADLQYLIDETREAKENHSVEHANNMYQILHDLDYFLLRYGPEDVGQYMTDRSTVSLYYGTLSAYT